MSIFGFKDRDVHFLTQVYQLDVPDMNHPDGEYPFYHGDLDRWLGIQAGVEYWSDTATPIEPMRLGTLSPKEEADRVANKPVQGNDAIKARFWRVPDIIALIKRIMQDVCDTQTLKEADAAELFELINTWQPKTHLEWEAGEDGRIDLRNLQLKDEGRSSTGKEWRLLRHLQDALVEAKDNPNYFRRCKECGNVFIVQNRSDQVNCSLRCNGRLGTRRYHEKHPRKKAKVFLVNT